MRFERCPACDGRGGRSACGRRALPRLRRAGAGARAPRAHGVHAPLPRLRRHRRAGPAALRRAAAAKAGSCRASGSTSQIPPGAGDGSRVRLPGLRQRRARRGGPPGDFVLVVEVEPHPLFRREGDDLHCEVPVTDRGGGAGRPRRGADPDGPVTIGMPGRGRRPASASGCASAACPAAGRARARGDLYRRGARRGCPR